MGIDGNEGLWRLGLVGMVDIGGHLGEGLQ